MARIALRRENWTHVPLEVIDPFGIGTAQHSSGLDRGR